MTAFLGGASPYTQNAAALRGWFTSGASERVPSGFSPAPRPILDAIPDDVLRTALCRAVKASTLRDVGGAVGINHGALLQYIRGRTRPREATQRKLRAWYLREAGNWAGPDGDTARAAIAVLLDGLPLAAQPDAEMAIADTVLNAFKSANISPPRWALSHPSQATESDGAMTV